ncbi:uncharacterized protein LOC131893196 [Tigriopus californicus]|uniref:uncharacterized protein LOC131893196 n=1 Tax=Tigriopus californicus TaxID=6832 RepID=UPI0027DA12B2|nr:uncharacterized protein LOC131893196 [Tigriopus californicus]
MYLSTCPPKSRSGLSTSSKRIETQLARHDAEVAFFFSSDQICSLDEITNKWRECENQYPDTAMIHRSSVIHFIDLIEDESAPLKLLWSVSVNVLLEVTIYVHGVTSSYRDAVALIPMAKIDAQTLKDLWLKVYDDLTELGFLVVATVCDGHAANRKMYQHLATNEEKDMVTINGRGVFLLFDPVHGLNNIYTNFLDKNLFTCPNFGTKMVKANFEHIQDLFYKTEHQKIVKIAHKLTDRVPKSIPIERSNVELACRRFDESTTNALRFYATELEDEALLAIAIFLSLVRQ